MNIGEAKKLTGGGLGHPSKMPGTSYGISAHKCITGVKLQKVEGSTCHGCYALKGHYIYNSVATAHERRLASISNPGWSAALAFLINKEYESACQEYTDLIRKHAKRAYAIRRSHSKATGYRSQTVGVGYGLGRRTKMVMAITRRPEVLNPAMYPLTLPRSGAIVALSPRALICTTSAATERALIRSTCNYLDYQRTSGYTQTSDATILPEGLEVQSHFRFHDSGDLQSIEHLTKICAVAALTPNVKHWLPTRELSIVLAYKAQGGIVPDNLVIRVSDTMIDGKVTKAWPTTSGVHTKATKAWGKARAMAMDWLRGVHVCPSPKYNNTCGPCRACWSVDVPRVSYHKH